ncbi:MAG TPA: hypothetical protein DCF63_00780, partial [Planctomycetaceae bacterium]|nr:hypothetical protein [Planctomycetaceae bacterium]
MDETPLSDQQIDWLLQWDEALAKGANAPQDSASQSPTDSGLANHVRCMKLLRMKQAILHSPSQHLQKSQTGGENTTVGLQSQENIRAIQVAQANFSGQLSDTLQVESNLQLTHPSVQSVPIHFGKFELIEEIGQGGYGIVFLARDRVLGRDVALKMPHANVMLKDDLLTRFRLEARAAGALDHPNIVQVFDAGSIGPVAYIASAYCPGTSLHEWIQKRTKVIALNDAARLILCLARAIQHANERGVFHRDLKPANILLQPSESYLQATGNIHTDQREQLVALAQAASLADLVPRITDFGLAKLTGQSLATLSGSVLGTPAYMAPEQASGQRQSSDSRVDVYSLGAILYQLLTGCLPFDGQTPWETLNRVIHEPVVPIRSRRHDIHRDLETICLKCLEKEPQQRYASAGLLADDLQRFIQNRPISARPATTRELLMRLFRRQPVASSLVLGTVLAMTLGLIIVIRLYRQSEDQRNRITTALNEAAQANKQATQQRQASERLTYLNSIAVADRESALDLSHARQKLVRCDPQLRDWEWNYLWKKCHPELLELTGHSKPTGVCCFSPDGSLLASGSGMWGRTTDGEVIVRETRTGEVLLQIDDIAGQVTGLDFHPTKNWLVVSEHTWRNDRSGVTKVWDLDSRQVVASLRLSRNTYSVCFDPAGDFVVTGGADGRIRFFRTANWRLARTINHHRQSVLAVTFDSTGQWLASAGRDGRLCVFDAQSREIVYQQDDLNDVRCVAFSPDSKYLACSTFDGQVFVWQTRDWELVARYAAPSKRVGSLEFCPDGDSILLSMISGPTQIWDVRTGQVRRSIPAHYPSTLYASCNVQGDLIATTGSDAKVRLWSVASQTEPLRYRVQSNFISDIVMIPNTNLVATGSTRNIASSGMGDKQYFVHLFDHTNGKTSRILKGHEDWISKLSITPDGQVLASTSHDGKVKLWSVAKGDCLHTLSGHSAPLIGAVFLDRQTLVSACQLGQLKFWDVSTGTNTRQRDTQLMGASSIVASSQTVWLALGNANGEIRIWNVDSPEHCIELQGHTGLINCMDFSDDGTQLAAGGISHQITFCDLPYKQECVDI